jgi:hypothetical protein
MPGKHVKPPTDSAEEAISEVLIDLDGKAGEVYVL